MDPINFYLSENDKFAISIARTGDLVTTPAGNTLKSSNKTLIEAIIYELQQFDEIEMSGTSIIGEPIENISLLGLFCTEIDFWSSEKEIPLEQLQDIVRSDPITNISPGPEAVAQMHQWREVHSYLHSKGFDWHDIQYYCEDRTVFLEMCAQLKTDFDNFSPPEKSVFINLMTFLSSPITSWAFVNEQIPPETLATIMSETASFQMIVNDVFFDEDGNEAEDKIGKKELFREVLAIGRVSRRYLDISKASLEKNLLDELEESVVLEFKASLRTPYPDGSLDEFVENGQKRFRLGKEVMTSKKGVQRFLEEQCLKTIVAFLNTKGGTLYIGVHEYGNKKEVVGVEFDEFESHDHYERHVSQMVINRIGEKFAGQYIQTKMELLKGKFVCVVRCEPYFSSDGQPAFLDGDKCYRRTGPRSDEIKNMREMSEFVAQRKQIKEV